MNRPFSTTAAAMMLGSIGFLSFAVPNTAKAALPCMGEVYYAAGKMHFSSVCGIAAPGTKSRSVMRCKAPGGREMVMYGRWVPQLPPGGRGPGSVAWCNAGTFLSRRIEVG